jgi:NADH dehydrogenase (ubiquinone) 1 alpha subcomplex subunit 6
MTTIPSRLAVATRASLNSGDARHRVLNLYRDWYRSVRSMPTDRAHISLCIRCTSQAPEIVDLYALNVSPAYIRHCIRQQFENNRYVTDQRAIDVLLLKGRQEYQETMNCWKQIDHIMGIMLKPQERTQRTFLQKFYEGEC